MINWKKEGIANSVTGWLFLGPVIFLVILTSMADIIGKSPTIYIVLLYILLLISSSLLIYSKVPNILSGSYFTFGSKNIVPERKKYYKASYLLLAISIFLASSIVLALEIYSM